MIPFSTILLTTLPVFFLVGLGMFFRRIRLFSGDSEPALMKLTVNVLYPALIFSKVVGSPSLDDWGTVGIALLLGFGFIVLGIAVAYAGTPLLGLRKGSGLRTFAVVTGTQNYGYLAIPIVGTLWGEELLGLLFVFSLGVELAIWTIGVALMAGRFGDIRKRLLNGPLVAIVIGLGLNAIGGNAWIAEPVRSWIEVVQGPVMVALEMLGRCAIPVGLLLVGSTLAGLIAEKSWVGCTRKTAVGAVLLRMIVIPALMLLVIALAPIAVDLKRIVVVQASMPAAVFPILIARHYGGHPATAVQVVLITTFVSLGTMPFVISYALILVGG